MEAGTVAVTLIITALIVLTGQQNGFVSAATSSTVPMVETSTTMMSTSTMMLSTTNGVAKDTNEMSSTSMQSTQPTTATIQPTTATTPSVASTAAPTILTQSSMKAVNSTTSAPKEKVEPLFHVVMIVMIVVLGFIIGFSVSCGLCVIFGIDVGCPIPCCGGGGKAKNPTISASGMKLKRSSRPDRISSQRLQDAEQFQEVECKGFKGHGSAYGQDNIVFEF